MTAMTGTTLRAALIAVVGVLVYANSLSGPFIFDDLTSIEQNPRIRTLWPLTQALSPPSDTPVAGRPLLNLTFAINYAVGGLDVTGYHLTNLAIHVLAALVLFGLVRRTMLLPSLAPRVGDAASNLAAAVALLWMVHPLNSEVVNYATQRSSSLMGLGYLLTMYCSVRALDAGAQRWQIAAVAACAAGMACKESMVTAPVMVAIFDRVFVAAAARRAAHRGRLYAGLAGTWLVLAGLMAARPRTTVGFDAGVSPWTYLLNQTTVIVDYLRLAIWPHGLVLDYGLPMTLSLTDVIVPGLILVGLGVITVTALVRWPRIGFLGAWFFVTLAPTSSIVPIATEVGAERRMYLPLAALVVLAVVCAREIWRSSALVGRLGRWAQASRQRRSRISGLVGAATLCCVCAALAAITIDRNREYQSWLSLSRTIVERRPHGRAYMMYGNALYGAGRRAEAVDYFRRSSVDYPGARFALGTELMASGQLAVGVEQLERFVAQMPTHISVGAARRTLGTAYVVLEQYDAAAAHFTELLKLEPDSRDAHLRLGEVSAMQNRNDEAIRHFQFVVERWPHDTEAMRKLGAALAGSGQVDAAAAVLERAVGVAPRDTAVRLLFGRVLAMAGRLDEAARQFAEALDIDPHNADARRDLARARAQAAGRR
jgi:tetratricopeptide (TPR) repeat protein